MAKSRDKRMIPSKGDASTLAEPTKILKLACRNALAQFPLVATLGSDDILLS